MKCTYCGAEIDSTTAKFCTKCGKPLPVQAQPPVSTTIPPSGVPVPAAAGPVWPEWTVDPRPLGMGSYGAIHRAVSRQNGRESCASVKKISIPTTDSEGEALQTEGLDVKAIKAYFQGIVREHVAEIQLMESLQGFQSIPRIEDYRILEKTDGIGWDIYVRMEPLIPFQAHLGNRVLSEAEVVKVGCDIAGLLEICAQRNIVHRDIQPENLFVGSFGSYKLGDLGMTRKPENIGDGLTAKITSPYMAPELLNRTDYDARVDIYSLGLVLYQLLNNNRLPFLDPARQLPNGAEQKKAIDRRLQGEALPAPCNASPQLASVILRACAYRPEDRFASAAELKQALSAVACSRPAPTVKPGPGYPAAAPAPVPTKKKNPTKIVLIAALIAIVILAAVIVCVLIFNDFDTGTLLPAVGNKSESSAQAEQSPAADPPDVPTVSPSTAPQDTTNYSLYAGLDWIDTANINTASVQDRGGYIFNVTEVSGSVITYRLQQISQDGSAVADIAGTCELYMGEGRCDYTDTRNQCSGSLFFQFNEDRGISITDRRDGAHEVSIDLYAAGSPMGYSGELVHTQRVMVYSYGSSAQVSFEQWEYGNWVVQYVASGVVGENGIIAPQWRKEGSKTTPEGTFDLGFAFAVDSLDTGLDFKLVRQGTYWVDDARSDYYNTWQTRDSYGDWNSAESLYSTFTKGKSRSSIVIEFNGDGLSTEGVTKGAGSAIFFSGRSGSLSGTNGDVFISQSDMMRILPYLDKDCAPVIQIHEQ